MPSTLWTTRLMFDLRRQFENDVIARRAASLQVVRGAKRRRIFTHGSKALRRVPIRPAPIMLAIMPPVLPRKAAAHATAP